MIVLIEEAPGRIRRELEVLLAEQGLELASGFATSSFVLQKGRIVYLDRTLPRGLPR